MKTLNETFLTAEAKQTKIKISIRFIADNGKFFDLPEDPGVYRVFSKKTLTTFYVGETGNLRQRLSFLYRCRQSKNPHPCHTDYLLAYNIWPNCEEFCKEFGVAITETKGLLGRIEIEEAKQLESGSNKADYYKNWSQKQLSSPKLAPVDAGIKPKIKDKLFYFEKNITQDMRKSGSWIFSKDLGAEVGKKEGQFFLDLPLIGKIEAEVGESKEKYLNKARSVFKDFLGNYTQAKKLRIFIEEFKGAPCLRIEIS